MGGTVSSCQKYLDLCSEELRTEAFPGASPEQLRRTPLLLRVDVATIRESMGTVLCPFSLTDELVVEALEKSPGFEPLTWRQARCSQQVYRAAEDGSQNSKRLAWPEGPRWTAPQRFLRAKINKHWFIMQVAVNPEDRTMEHAKAVIEDAKDAAAYAHRFNAELARMAGAEMETGMGDDGGMPRVQVCAPVGCSVLRPGLLSNLVNPGNVVVLTPYPAVEIRKFVFDGTEDFLELPQAFFHYVAWLSGGAEFVYDLQGFEGDDGDIWLADPCFMKAPRPGVGDIFAPLGGSQQSRDDGPSQERFDMLHPRCGPLCKGFDPQRKGIKARHVCGMGVKGACGLGRV